MLFKKKTKHIISTNGHTILYVINCSRGPWAAALLVLSIFYTPGTRHRNSAAIFIESLSHHHINIQTSEALLLMGTSNYSKEESSCSSVRLGLFTPAAHNIMTASLFMSDCIR